jgi:hypothetical protein
MIHTVIFARNFRNLLINTIDYSQQKHYKY